MLHLKIFTLSSPANDQGRVGELAGETKTACTSSLLYQWAADAQLCVLDKLKCKASLTPVCEERKCPIGSAFLWSTRYLSHQLPANGCIAPVQTKTNRILYLCQLSGDKYLL
ncbi:unnamed protein product, partial [Mesorhabditis spiculigera]